MNPRVILASVASLFLIGVSSAEAATAVGIGKPAVRPVPSSASVRAPKFVEGQVLVAFSPATPAQVRADAHAQVGGQVLRRVQQLNLDVVSVPAGTVLSAIATYQRNPNVRHAEPNYLRRLTQTLPNEYQDPNLNYMTEQWGLHNTGQMLYYRWIDEFTVEYGVLKGTPDADIDFAEAWARLGSNASIRNQNIVIAVLDAGVQCDHTDLVGKCVEPQQNFSPSVYSYDDYLGHGTHVAAIAAANTNNGIGTAGVGWNAKLANIKVCYEEDLGLGYIAGLCDDASIAQGLTYAADQGYQIINMSLAGPDPGLTVGAAVSYALARGTLIIAGAGNEYTQDKMYPAGFDGVVAVGATDYFDNLASFSSFGNIWVQILAPGVNILSAISTQACYGLPDCYDWKSGTSMATPHVSGAAALVWGYMKSLSRTVSGTIVRDILLNSTNTTGALGQNFRAWAVNGRLNLNDAITMADTGAPPPSGDTTPPVISSLASRITNKNGSFEITWTTNEPATSDVSLNGSWYNDATLTTNHKRSFRGTRGATYSYTVRSADAAGNSSMASGVHNN